MSTNATVADQYQNSYQVYGIRVTDIADGMRFVSAAGPNNSKVNLWLTEEAGRLLDIGDEVIVTIPNFAP